MPDWYVNAPEVVPYEEFFLTAYAFLSTERKYEGGPIPHSAIVAYAMSFDFDRDMINGLVQIIMAIDNAVVKEIERHRKLKK